MNKPQKNIKEGYDRATELIAFLKNNYSDFLFESLDKERDWYPIHKKSNKNTLSGRRGTAQDLSSDMGITIKVKCKITNKNIFLEPRICTESTNYFNIGYYKMPSNLTFDESGLALALDATAFLVVSSSSPKKYQVYTHDQISKEKIIWGSKGSGNKNRVSYISLHLTPIPIEGKIGYFPEPSLKIVIKNLIDKIGK